jgi:hypothetical protein
VHGESCGPDCSQEPGAQLMAELGAIDQADERRARLRANFQMCDNAAMEYLGVKLQAGEAGNWQALLEDLQALMQERLEAGKELLKYLLAAGEINVLDRKIVEKVKSGECDPSFLNVLQINLQDAEQNIDNEEQGGSQVARRSQAHLFYPHKRMPSTRVRVRVYVCAQTRARVCLSWSAL